MKKNSISEYEAAINMRNSEAQIQWERFNAMLVVNTIFMTLLGLSFVNENKIPPIIRHMLPILGIFLCILWNRMTGRGFMWTKFWITKARNIEEKFGSNNQINPIIDGYKYHLQHEETFNTRQASSLIIWIFIIIYLIIFMNNVIPYICGVCSLK